MRERRPVAPAILDDTIAALSTPPGRAAIAVIRLSGAGALDIAARVLDPWPLPPRTATVCTARASDGALLDHPLVTVFEAPRSYTGEHVVELSTHGGYAAPAAVMAALVAAGARPALAGEFTRRAVLNGKLDLVQAEAIGDLIDASTDAMRRAAIHQLDGALSRRIDALRDSLLDLEALLAYDIDFPEEDEGPIARQRVDAAGAVVLATIDALLSTAPAGALVREGAIVVIAGAPNVGKSTLFNAIIGEARAIVTEIPGTTRDAIEVAVEHDGWPLRLVDTAGLRVTHDVVERLGIEVSERYLAGAHAVIACADNDAGIEETVARIRSVAREVPVIPVRTKADLHGGSESGAREARGARGARGAPPQFQDGSDVAREPHHSDADGVVPTRDVSPGGGNPHTTPLSVSGATGAGIPALLDRVAAVLRERYGAPGAEMPMLTRARHVAALRTARGEVAAFRDAWGAAHLPAPVAAVHIRAAIGALDGLIGAVDVEDVLGRVFATFCVGK